jgi:hypothetical protein
MEPWQVRCYGDDRAIQEWRAAVRTAGHRVRDSEDEDGYPVLIVFLLGSSDMQAFVRTMQKGGISGWLEPMG